MFRLALLAVATAPLSLASPSPAVAEKPKFELFFGTVRGPKHTGHGFSCVDEDNCDEEKYYVCAHSLGGGVDYLACQDGASGSPEAKAKGCASETGLSWSDLSTCFAGDEGTKLLTAAADHFEQRFPQPVGVPRVEIHGKEEDSRKYADLLQTLCATGIKAGACSKILIV